MYMVFKRATLVYIYIKVDRSGWRNRPVQARNYSISLNRGDYMYLLVLFHLVSCVGMVAAGHRHRMRNLTFMLKYNSLKIFGLFIFLDIVFTILIASKNLQNTSNLKAITA